MISTTSCEMMRQQDVDACLDGSPGSYFFDIAANGQRRMWFVLPNGDTGVINIRPVISDQSHPSWEWDGNLDKPTLTPSVNQVGRWHGFFRNGRMESC